MSPARSPLPATDALLPSSVSALLFLGGVVVVVGLAMLVGLALGRRRPAPAQTPPGRAPWPIDRDRVGNFLTARDYHFVIDDDGDITGLWDSHRFWFLLMGEQREIIQVRGRWARTLAPEHRSLAMLAINDWNRDRIWPKSYLREEDGRLAVYTEVSADLEPGATDEQLGQILSCGLGTAVTLFRELDVQIPADGSPPPAA